VNSKAWTELGYAERQLTHAGNLEILLCHFLTVVSARRLAGTRQKPDPIAGALDRTASSQYTATQRIELLDSTIRAQMVAIQAIVPS